ncbi:MAG: L-seryl-tRNA(Sec) selenium transferase [Pyrinomonadaceae bacterium]|nr:L-seryl-tRNA(Sec) selenium transferase [Pyrinomonadaceae bacterium]
MSATKKIAGESALRLLPSVDKLLRTEAASKLRGQAGRERLTQLARRVLDEMRAELEANSSGIENSGRERVLEEAARRLQQQVARERDLSLRRVINATGVVLHTNLGRAPLSLDARRAVADEAAGYCTLEYDAEKGERGRRGARVETLLAELTGAEAAFAVNNCAAAALLVLAALARDGETIISRGELVEIGGDFRVPDVMAQSGTTMIEVGTTNRTRLSDYEKAINEHTRLILRVHPSNYRIIGFTHAPDLAELARLAHDHNLPLYQDAGSGLLLDFPECGLEGEPVIPKSLRQNVDIVSFSGDKLLGGAQAGLIVGREKYINLLRRHPLARALRLDKLALAALEATLEAYRRGTAQSEIPVLNMIAQTYDQLERRAFNFVEQLRGWSSEYECEIITGASAIGGGSAPTTHPSTALIRLTHHKLSANRLEQKLRQENRPPVVARLINDAVVIDLRTVAEDEEAALLKALCNS